jgi:hypothetical protein
MLAASWTLRRPPGMTREHHSFDVFLLDVLGIVDILVLSNESPHLAVRDAMLLADAGDNTLVVGIELLARVHARTVRDQLFDRRLSHWGVNRIGMDYTTPLLPGFFLMAGMNLRMVMVMFSRAIRAMSIFSSSAIFNILSLENLLVSASSGGIRQRITTEGSQSPGLSVLVGISVQVISPTTVSRRLLISYLPLVFGLGLGFGFGFGLINPFGSALFEILAQLVVDILVGDLVVEVVDVLISYSRCSWRCWHQRFSVFDSGDCCVQLFKRFSDITG